MHPILLRLSEGSYRTALQIAPEASGDPGLIAVLVDALSAPAPALRNKAAVALDPATRRRPRSLAPHVDALLAAAEADRHGPALRRTLPLLLSAVPLTEAQADAVAAHARQRLADGAPAAKANALTALASVAEQHPAHRDRVLAELDAALDAPSPSLRARARRLLYRLDRA